MIKRILLPGLLLAMMLPVSMNAQISRVASRYKNWDGTDSTVQPGKTTQLFNVSFNVPTKTGGGPAYNTMFVTLHSTGSTPGGEGIFGCRVDGTALCINSTAKTHATHNNQIALLNNPGPNLLEDNSINYSWCLPITAPGAHAVRLTFTANSAAVFLEANRVDVDLANIPGGLNCSLAK